MLVRDLAAVSPSLEQALTEHLADNGGEVLPHLFMGDVTRTLVRLDMDGDREDVVTRALELLEDRYAEGVEEVQELVAVSFLENLPGRAEPGADLRGRLGPELTAQLQRMFRVNG